jgi:hypothetical protein
MKHTKGCGTHSRLRIRSEGSICAPPERGIATLNTASQLYEEAARYLLQAQAIGQNQNGSPGGAALFSMLLEKGFAAADRAMLLANGPVVK